MTNYTAEKYYKYKYDLKSKAREEENCIIELDLSPKPYIPAEISVDNIDIGSFDKIDFQRFKQLIDSLNVQNEVSTKELYPINSG